MSSEVTVLENARGGYKDLLRGLGYSFFRASSGAEQPRVGVCG